mgnify:CR=1 FL=1
MDKVILGIGTNTGNREMNLKAALKSINLHAGTIRKSSSIYETSPWGFTSDEKFLNMVVEIETTLNPYGLLGKLLMIEALQGRLRNGAGYASRIIDIDILFYGEKIINEGELIVPHPRLHQRRFILIPLCEITPELIHPVSGKTVFELLNECNDDGSVSLYCDLFSLS